VGERESRRVREGETIRREHETVRVGGARVRESNNSRVGEREKERDREREREREKERE